MSKKSKIVSIYCLNCNKEIKLPEYIAKKRKFCSNKCASGYNAKQGKIGGDISSLYKLIYIYGPKEGIRRYKEKSKKLSENLTKRYENGFCPMLGKTHTPETKSKLSESVKNSNWHTQFQYKTFDEVRGKNTRKQISETLKGIYTLKWFIEKYGEEEGLIKYTERSNQLKNSSFFIEYNKTNKSNYSKISQDLFWNVYNKIENLKNEKVYFAELNHEFSCGSRHNFDFVAETRKRVIEFYGDVFHANPNLFNENDTPHPYNKSSSKIIWEIDQLRNNLIINKGYKILIIWEKDYRDNKEKIINDCINFLEEK